MNEGKLLVQSLVKIWCWEMGKHIFYSRDRGGQTLGYLQMNMSAEHSCSTKDWINVLATLSKHILCSDLKQYHDIPLPVFQKATQVSNWLFSSHRQYLSKQQDEGSGILSPFCSDLNVLSDLCDHYIFYFLFILVLCRSRKKLWVPRCSVNVKSWGFFVFVSHFSNTHTHCYTFQYFKVWWKYLSMPEPCSSFFSQLCASLVSRPTVLNVLAEDSSGFPA